jgi:hypothetical protein
MSTRIILHDYLNIFKEKIMLAQKSVEKAALITLQRS